MGIFDISDKRDLKRFNKVVDKIDDLEPKFEEMSNEELQNMTNVFKERLGKGETLDQILPEAFATVREASKRVLGLKHYRVQLIGGMVLHEGRIAEMKTGEGKTLVATCPVYLNALEGKGVHVITVNDYLAKRDRDQMAQVYEFLGMSVGVVIHGQNPKERRDQYNCDITYGTNNEFGFDYLKDNMVVRREDKVQRELHYAIVDEVDSILIDEARTPLIISGPGNKPASLYLDADVFVRTLNQDDFEKDEKEKAVSLTESGIKKAELYFNVENLADLKNVELNHHINQALKAHVIMKKDIDYVPKDGEIIIVDEFTGRLMMGRRYSEGLHQAIEAKEGLNVQSESTTMATITFQNYFRMYKKLSGMTGTAKTEEDEFKSIYKMDVFQIPTNKPVIRQDLADVVYKDQKSKFNAVVKEITERHAIGQPVLVGTVSINKSEILSNILKDKGIPHNVLNAKFHEQEAEIVAQAGKFGAVTIATNMAGRGTDIVLGGNPAALAIKDMKKMNFTDSLIQRVNFAEEIAGVEDAEELEAARKVYKELLDKYKVETEKEKEKVLEVGGLCIIGTERHDSRRIDNQLRGRAGRQGDPGVSKFFLALDDDLMRLFGTDRLTGMADKLGINDTPIEHRILTKSIENAQKKVEGRNFGIRKSTLEFDDVMNKQRTVIYTERNKVLNGEDVHQDILNMIHKVICDEVDRYYGKIEFPELKLNLYDSFMPPGSLEVKGLSTLNQTELKDALIEIAEKRYEGKEESLTPKYFHDFERTVILESVDKNWIEHIDAMDQLRQFIGLKALGQQDPIIAYKMEGYKMFEEMNNRIKYDVVQAVLSLIITRIS